MLQKPRMDLGALKGLIFRRLKWHRAEYNRICALWSRLEDKETAQRAKDEHWGALKELYALNEMREPSWGMAREEAEQYLNWEPDAGDTLQETVPE